MKKIILTSLAALTLIACSPEEESPLSGLKDPGKPTLSAATLEISEAEGQAIAEIAMETFTGSAVVGMSAQSLKARAETESESCGFGGSISVTYEESASSGKAIIIFSDCNIDGTNTIDGQLNLLGSYNEPVFTTVIFGNLSLTNGTDYFALNDYYVTSTANENTGIGTADYTYQIELNTAEFSGKINFETLETLVGDYFGPYDGTVKVTGALGTTIVIDFTSYSSANITINDTTTGVIYF